MPAPTHAHVDDVLANPLPRANVSVRRADIEGLRAVAALLIATYHIWFGTISGGVDVFLLLTGFLITGSLVRTMERNERINLAAFWSKLVKRLFPAGAVVLGAALVGSYLFLPRSRWTDVIAEVQASALHYVNWYLANNAVDYLAQNNAASPVQHFWSLAIQGQFYVLWPILMALSGIIAVWLSLRIRHVALATVAAVLAVSFGYSLWVTSSEPVWAYFDTGARLWELALGGLLALALPWIRLPRRPRIVLGWLGLMAMVSCGFLIGDTLAFPGYASLWPTLAALLIIVAGTGDTGSFSANRLLAWRPLTWLGGHAYTLFLWHWPVLIVYLELTEQVRPSLAGGFLVLGISFAAALATSWTVDRSITRFTRKYRTPSWSLAAGIIFVIPVLIAGNLWSSSITRQSEMRAALSSDPAFYPGAAVLLDPELAENLPVLPVYPDTTNVGRDTVRQTHECNALGLDTELVSCEFGDLDSEYTIAMVGSSHVRHWFHALVTLSDYHGWRLVTITKNSCQFSAATQYRRSGEEFVQCNDWNEEAMEMLTDLRPDTVFSLATLTSNEPGSEEHVPDGFVQRWNELNTLGIKVIAVRDTPRFDFQVPECLDRNDRSECTEKKSYSMSEVSPHLEIENIPTETHFLDMTGYLCQEGICPGVIGNHIVFYDTDHFSYSFSQSLALVMEPYLLEILGQEIPKEKSSLADSIVLDNPASEDEY